MHIKILLETEPFYNLFKNKIKGILAYTKLHKNMSFILFFTFHLIISFTDGCVFHQYI